MNTNNLATLSYLIVDDEPRSQRVLKTLLEKGVGGSNISIISDNTRFLSDLSELSMIPDVIFLDLMMEPYNGYDLLRMLRHEERYQKTVIIAVTARAMTHDIEQMKKEGFNGLISKPIVRKVFPELLQRIINGEPVWYVA